MCWVYWVCRAFPYQVPGAKPWRVLTEIEGNGGIEGNGVTSGREVFALDVYGPPCPSRRGGERGVFQGGGSYEGCGAPLPGRDLFCGPRQRG